MNLIVGASGQIGSTIVNELRKKGIPVTAIIRNPDKAAVFDDIPVQIADIFNTDSLIKAFDGGDTVFLLTPESFHSEDVIGDGERMIACYRQAIERTGIRRVVGLSSLGAHLGVGTGNLEISYKLEHAFDGLSIETTFIRPAYYFSNWLGYIDVIKSYGVLPTFFEPNQKIPMIAPNDVARFAASVLMSPTPTPKVIELVGPQDYSTFDVANAFSKCLGIDVIPHQTPREQWLQTLTGVGFSENAARNMIAMTETLTNENNTPASGLTPIRQETSLEEYICKNNI